MSRVHRGQPPRGGGHGADGSPVAGCESRFAAQPLGPGERRRQLLPHRRATSRTPFGHRHEEQEEVYVVLSGTARLRRRRGRSSSLAPSTPCGWPRPRRARLDGGPARRRGCSRSAPRATTTATPRCSPGWWAATRRPGRGGARRIAIARFGEALAPPEGERRERRRRVEVVGVRVVRASRRSRARSCRPRPRLTRSIASPAATLALARARAGRSRPARWRGRACRRRGRASAWRA